MSGMTLAEAAEHITSTDPLYAVGEADIRGVTLPVFTNIPKSLRELQQYGRENRDYSDYIIYQDERWSYERYCAESNKISHILTERLGIKPGDHVAIAMRNYPEYLSLFMGIVNIGAVAVLVNAWWTTDELTYGFEDSGAKLVFADGPRAERIAPFAEKLGITTVGVRDMTDGVTLDGLLARTDDTRWPTVDIDPDADFALMYSSGSTGHPKGIMLTHRGALSAVFTWNMSLLLPPLMTPEGEPTPPNPGPQSLLIATPLFHVTASHALYLLSMALRAKVVIMHKWDGAEALRLINQEQVTRFVGVPTMTADMRDVAERDGIETPSLQVLTSGGAKRPPAQVGEQAEAFPNAALASGWGMTETNAAGIAISGPDYVGRPDQAGRIFPPLQEARIVDTNNVEVPRGTLGELSVKGPNMMRCYHNKPEATAETLIDGWLLSGDLGIMDEDGYVTIVDRAKNIIIRGGENISGLEVEAAIHQHPAVGEAAVFACPDDRYGEVVGAIVWLKEDAAMTGADVKAFLTDKIANYKHPAKLWWTDAPLLKGATDKIDRRALKDLCLSGEVGTEDNSI